MQRLLFEKSIDLDHHLTELISINVDDHLAYSQEEKGMRATGELEISGEYLKNISRERFNDTLSLDIFAPEDRLDKNDEFYLEISDFDYRIQSGNLSVEVTVLCHGIQESDEKRVEIVEEEEDQDEQALIAQLKEMIEPDPHKDALKAAIEEELIRQEEESAVTEEEVIAPEPDQASQVLEVKESEPVAEPVFESERPDQVAEKMSEPEKIIRDDYIDVEDLFDDDQDAYVIYRIYVVSPGDTYASIAMRYGLDADRLAHYHHEAPLVAHQLLLIPDER